MNISVVINTKNMANSLDTAIKSVQKFAFEVVVVDMKSTDNTVAVAEKLGAKIWHFPQDLGFADPARNFALSKAKGDWILVLDADEEVSEGLANLLPKIVAGQITTDLLGDCYFLPRQNIIFGKTLQHTGWWPDYQLRFFRTDTVRWTDEVHTQPIPSGRVVHLPAEAQFSLIHHNYQTIDQFINRLNRYTDLELSKKNKRHTNQNKISAQQIVDSFSGELFQRLFAGQGMADGLHGLSLSFLQSFYEVTVTLKQWQRSKFAGQSSQREIAEAMHGFHHDLGYWLLDWQFRHSLGPARVYWLIRRKLHQMLYNRL